MLRRLFSQHTPLKYEDTPSDESRRRDDLKVIAVGLAVGTLTLLGTYHLVDSGSAAPEAPHTSTPQAEPLGK